MTEIATIPTNRKRKRGGQPGNLNGSKNPWTTFWRRRALKREERWVIPLIEDYADGLIADKGGVDSATAAERHVIEIAQTARASAMLVLKECSARGMIIETLNGWDLAPGAKELAKFLSVELNALRTIGMERRKPRVKSIDEIMQEMEQAEQQAEQAQAEQPATATTGAGSEGEGES